MACVAKSHLQGWKFPRPAASLAAEVIYRTLGRADDAPPFRMLDSTNPDVVRRSLADAETSLFIVASKSGTTVEPNAMAAAEVTTPNSIEPLQQVRIRVDLRGPGKKLLPTKGRLAVAIQPMGDRAWMVELPIDSSVSLEDDEAMASTKCWELSADYTELEILNTEPQEATP